MGIKYEFGLKRLECTEIRKKCRIEEKKEEKDGYIASGYSKEIYFEIGGGRIG